MPGEARTPGGTVIRNKPIMIFLHPNTEQYDPDAGSSLLVNLGALEDYEDLLDDCTARMKMHTFAGQLFTPSGELIRGLEDVEPKSHLIVVAEKEVFKVQAMAEPEEGEPPQSSSSSSSSSTAAPDRQAASPSDSAAAAEAPSPEPAPATTASLALSPAAPVTEAPAPSATFRKYDLNGDGVLDRDEIINMMQSLGYKTDEAYLENLMEAFATFDKDDSGVIEQAEFEALYDHLGGEPEGEPHKDRSATEEQQGDPLFAEFQKYDTSNRGYLSQYDVSDMMKRLGYKVTPEYLQETMDHFATNFDKDSDGVIDFEEFKALYVHLGGAPEGTAVEIAQDDPRREHPMWELFSKYDLNGDGKLSQYEVTKMMEDMGYKTEESYVQQTMELFGEHDDNGDHCIDLDEFTGLWEHLGGELPANVEAQESKSPARDSKLEENFTRYDADKDGVLSREEVGALMVDLGYKASMDYLDGVMDAFATNQKDGSPAVQFEDFEQLWKHLGGGEHAGAAAAAEGSQDTPYRAEFDKYDLNRDGLLSPLEVQQMMTSLGYKANSDYVSQLLETFGSFDADDDGVIEPAEFYHLWEHLGAHKSDGDDEEAAAATEEPKQKPGRDLRKIFDRFDVDNNGILDHAEVKGMMLKLGYKTTDDYVEQTMQLFASFDQDSDGMIQLEEFEPLWDHLGGDQILSAPDTGLSEADSSDPLYERFASFDLTGTGFLTRHEIQAMMAKLGYAANDQYLSDLLGLFGSFDKDGDGCVDFEEWKGLWAHLGGEDAMGETDEAAKAEANAHEVSDPLWATFVKYDKTGSKSLSGYEVKQMMIALGYKADEQYLQGLLDLFGQFDDNGDGVVEFNEFRDLWAHLGGEPPIEGAQQQEGSSSDVDPEFDYFDLNADGVLSAREIKAFMVAHNFAVDEEYVAGLIDSFASQDDGDYLTRDDFADMREHLCV